MTQISRPFQIALAVLVLFVAVWFLALRGHSSSGSGAQSLAPAVSSASSSSPSSSAASANTSTSSSSAPGSGSKAAQHKAHHAAAPAAGGLKHAIVKAQGAVKRSEHKASATHAAKAAPKPATTRKSASANAAKPHAVAPAKANVVTSANMQKAVEAELKHGSVVALLFWNPKGTVDGVVRHELQAVSHSSHGNVAVHVARADEIGSFGSFTRAVQVYSTPTILLINTKGKTSSLTGLTDAFGIEQAVREVKQAK
jgi:hypothetical protein